MLDWPYWAGRGPTGCPPWRGGNSFANAIDYCQQLKRSLGTALAVPGGQSAGEMLAVPIVEVPGLPVGRMRTHEMGKLERDGLLDLRLSGRLELQQKLFPLD